MRSVPRSGPSKDWLGKGGVWVWMNQSGWSSIQRESMPMWFGTMSLARRMP